MASVQSFFASAVAVFVLTGLVSGEVMFSSLQRTLTVDVEIQNQVPSTGLAKVGDDYLVVKWSLNATQAGPPGLDATYSKVQLKLCYAPVSQSERGWRKTKDDLHKDKTCVKTIATQKYTSEGNSTVWRIAKDVPGALYFVRAYALNAGGLQVAYGQTTDKTKTTNLIMIEPISGRSTAIDISAAVFSTFSIGSLLFFLAFEKMRSKRSSKK